tara:strand:+ start:199 stop:1368 length:1170 start_codon:yes stop_codon:yes gene_type:complete
MSIKVLNGNCMEVLDQLPEKSVDTCITSPPYYGLRDYEREGQIGLEETPEEYVENMVEVFRKVRRVLKDEGTVWLNLGDSYASNHYTGARDSDTGWKHGELSQGYQARAGGAGGVFKVKDLMGIPWMVAFALRADGWYLRQDIIWHKPNPMPESVTDRCTKAHEYIFLLSKNVKYYFDSDAIKEDAVGNNPGNKTKHRAVGQPFSETKNNIDKISAVSKRNKRSVWTVTTKPFKGAHFAVFPPDLIKPCVLAGCPEKVCVECDTPYEREMEDVDVEPKKNISIGDDRKEFDSSMGGGGTSLKGHSGYFKSDGTPVTTPKKDLGFKKQCQCETDETKSGTVLDPFGGAGTTGLVADRNGRNAILIELNDEYAEMSRDRLYNDAPLFVDVE